jgi:molybdenum-dependent DNA-binding transcriptional regulator ModE
METLLMSSKERKRLVLLTEVKKGSLSLAQAGRTMGVCYRQAKRIWQRFRQRGDAGLVHRSRGRPGARRKKGRLRAQVLARYQQRYPDFGPTLAAEKLQAEGLPVDHETLRRWLIQKGLWTLGRRQRQQHRSWRERKECFGQMVQLDGSHHDWFEGRRDKAVLMVMVDDATNHTLARFFEEETTQAAYEVFEAWVREQGLPQSLYVDRDSIYRSERVPTVQEQIGGKEPQTQFGRAMEQLGVELILAHSPQAKGRVERRNGLLQDRLVKELRLAGVKDLAAANEFLEEQFLPALNGKFMVQARSPVDVHRQGSWNLAEILSWEEARVVAKDWTVAWQGRWFQILAEHAALSLVGRQVVVRRLRCGRVDLLYEGKKLSCRELPGRPERVGRLPRRVGRTRLYRPAPEHPWRQSRIAVGREFWKAEKARGRQIRRTRDQAATASGQPPLRSGFPTAVAA